MDTVLINKLQYLLIGQQGENAANNIPIDMTPWVEEFPNARFHLLFKAYNTTSPLPMVTTYDAETHILTWTPTLDATQNAGVGYTEVRAIDHDNGVLKKSRIIPTTVENSVTGVEGGTVPEPYEDWVNLVLGYKDAAEDAQAAAELAQGKAEDAQEAAETAQGLAETAQEAAETAQGKAEDAQEAAETAQGKAEDAQEAAETAQGLAEDAQTAAETAQGKAEDAQTAAETAQGKAEDAQDAAEDAKVAAEAAKNALLGASATASTLPSGSPATASLTWSSGTANFVFGLPSGMNASIVSTVTAWQNSQSGTEVPSGTWETTQPTTPQGYYLWTRYTLTWNTGATTVMYTISRMGVDGTGSVTAVKMNGQTYSPDAQGVVDLGTIDMSAKADKVQSATAGDVATLDGNGNLVDSGKTLGVSVPANAVFTDTTYSPFTGATSSVAGSAGLVPAPTASDPGKFLKGDGTWAVAANPPTTLSLTAAAGSWSSATPPTQTLSATGVTASNTIIVGLADDATSVQLEAAQVANIRCTAQATNEIMLTCYGTEPEVNIPISVVILG